MTAVYVVIALVVVLLVAVVVMYNRFVRQRALIEESWKQIDVELNRRHDLIPNLVSTVQGYADHERGVLEQLTAAREAAQARKDAGPGDRAVAEEALGRAVTTVLARAEAYPDLKASANFLELQRELTGTEDRIAAARRFYNANVRAYNTRVHTFPSTLVASGFGFADRDYFELTDPAAREVPSVHFGR
ncbi:MAG: LemA family protein [Marmoricola sp.]